MRIKSIYVENFRSIRRETLTCDDLTVVVGANGAGKSSFLQALEVFYDTNAKCDVEDFCDRHTDTPIVIRVTYSGLRPDEREEFKSYLAGDTLTVTKRITCVGGKIEQNYYASASQIPDFAGIRELPSKTDQRNAWNELVESGKLPGLSEKVRAAGEIEALMQKYETDHPDLLQPRERQEQFFGPRNVGGGKLDKYTKFVHLPAVREVSAEATGRSSTLTQLLETLVTRKLMARIDVQEFKRDFDERLKSLYAPDKTADLKELAKNISKTLGHFVPGAEFGLNFGDVNLPELPAPQAIPKLTEDGFEGDITRKGHGLQRALIFTLLQHLAVLQRESTQSPTEDKSAPAEGDAKKNAGPDLILAIEEPELYQHPQRCRYLADLLLELSVDASRGVGAGNQVIYTTHSAYFVSLDRFEQIRLARKKKDGVGAPVTTVSSFSMTDAASKAGEISDSAAVDAFTAKRFKARAYPVMTTVVSEGFFASVVGVVEGMTEAGSLWRLSEILGLDWKQKNIAIIPAGGKSVIDRPIIIFGGLKIPTYFVFDGDVRHKGSADKERSNVDQNQRCLRLAGVAVVDFPSTTVGNTWACFEDEFETYIRTTIGNEKFELHRKTIADLYGYEKEGDALKNFDAVGDFIDLLYKNDLKLPVLEDIAKAISNLA